MPESKNPKKHAGKFTAIGCAFVVLAIVTQGSLKWPFIIIALAFLIYALVVSIRGKRSET